MGKKRMGYCMGVPIDVEVPGYSPPAITEDWQRCCLAYQGDTVPCETACLHCHRMAEVVAAERKRCAGIVQNARHGERDQDFRSIIYAIEHPGWDWDKK